MVRASEAHGKRCLVIAVSVISCLALVESATFSYMLPDLIADLKPEIADNLKLIAREEVEVAKLQREVTSKQD